MMDLKSARPDFTPVSQKQKKKLLPLISNLDYCYRYRPLADRSTFEQELQHTEGELVQYFPKAVSEQYRGYERTSKYITVGFWAVSLSFAAFCHKIGFLSRLLGDKTWKMFGFKLSALVLPYLAMDNLMPQVESEQMNFLWQNMSESYRRYKYSGDMLQLNREIIQLGQGLTPPAIQQQ